MGSKKVWIFYLLFVLLLVGGVTTFLYLNRYQYRDNPDYVQPVMPDLVKVVNTSSKTRPVAVMINNLSPARANHAGLQDAYLTYEIIVEGGLTRLMALYKDKTTERIGSVRSSRHYFLDYAMENDAIYVHHGWSPQAQDDIKTYQINNINGLYDSAFFRDTTLKVAYEHTSFTTMEKINKVIDQKKYRKETDKGLLLKYSRYSQGLKDIEGSKLANQVSIVYSQSIKTSYTYDPETGTYLRFVNGVPHTDAITKKQYTVKNIITYQVGNTTINDGSGKGRQEIENLGSGDGYYISEGHAVAIKWYKQNRDSKTIYRYLNGEELVMNDGNTYIQIQPTGETLTISE